MKLREQKISYTHVVSTSSVELLENKSNKTNKTKFFPNVQFYIGTFCSTFGLFMKLHYLDPTIQIVQSDELLFCLIYLVCANILKSQMFKSTFIHEYS